METHEALRELRKVTYKDGWTFRFRVVGRSVAVDYEFRADNSTPRHLDDREWVIADGTFMLRVHLARTRQELHRMFLDAIHDEPELHETREFYKVDGFAPFHPHRVDGDINYDQTERVAA